MRILFMGTPDFAAESLNAMVNAGLDVVGVISQPDKPKGRGHKLVPTEVKVAAQAAGIEVYQPTKLKNNALMPLLDELKPELIVVTAYGRILPQYIINYPKYGCINVHASLLPKLRGAAPIQWSIINGDEITGVTTMKMDEGLDTGDILLTRQTQIGEYETAEELFGRLAKIGGELLIETIKNIKNIIRIDKKIRSYINELKHYPYIGRYVPEIPDKCYRERICEKYRIIYLISEKYKTIFIRYIFNAKQDKSAFLENHKIEIFDFFNRLFN